MTAPDWERVKEIFTAATEMAEAERAAYLRRACAGDAPLQGEVESLIASHQSAGGFLEDAAVTEAAGLVERELTEQWIGRRVGAYVLIEELGRGGMGQVFRARRADGEYHSEVAIKLVRAGYESQLVLRRFLAERQILAKLVHPAIARLLDGGTTADNVPYLVMELIDGVPIDQYCAEQELPIAARLRLFLSVCEAVSYAHRHLVVHRDLKPSNILITRDQSVKLLDFGVAKALDSLAPAGANQPTVTLLRALTVGFASPEQIRGEPITTASDVYSLGVLLYHLLTGGSPYRSADSAVSVVAREICEQSPALPSATHARVHCGTSERHWRTQLSGDLDSVVMRALQKDPAQRFSSVDLLAADLRRHLDHRPVLARSHALGDRMKKFVRRHRLATAVSAAAVMAVATSVALVGRHERIAAQESALRLAATHRTARLLLEQLQSRRSETAATGTEPDIEPLLRRLEALAASTDDEALRVELEKSVTGLRASGHSPGILSRGQGVGEPADHL